jgi:hypothetical protein
MLTVTGTPGADTISITRLASGTLHVAVVDPSGMEDSRDFDAREVVSIHVDAGAGDDIITLDIWGSGIVPGGITVETGAGDDVVHLLSLPSVTAISNSGGADTVDVGNSAAGLQNIVGPLTFSTVATVPSSIALNLDDGADPVSREATLSAPSLRGLSPALISWGAARLASLNIQGGSGGNTYFVTGTPGTVDLPVPATVLMGSGDDTLHLESASSLTVDGQGGNNTLVVETGATRVWNITDNNAGFVELPGVPGAHVPGPGTNVTFSNVENLDGEAGNDLFVFNNGVAESGTLKAGGGSGTLDYTAYSTNVIVCLPLGLATGVYDGRPGGISGFTTVLGGQGGAAGTYNILVGDGGDTLVAGTGRRNLLIAGQSSSSLYGGDSDDILIGGQTSYDRQIPALQALMNEWARADEDQATRADHVHNGTGIAGGFHFDGTTVQSNGGGNWLQGHYGDASATAADLFFAGNIASEAGCDYDGGRDIYVTL